tara:strand:+ start:132 stop:293 length:162 start_codon:yes stop_codon:yes gene_type:complete
MKRGISQMKLSFDTGVDSARISRIIRGWEKPTEEIKDIITKYLKVEEKEIFDD